MRDYDFRLGPVSGYFGVRPETNSLGFYIDRRGRSFTINVGLIVVDMMVTLDLETPKQRHDRRARMAVFSVKPEDVNHLESRRF